MKTTWVGGLCSRKHVDISLSRCVVSEEDLTNVLKIPGPLGGKGAAVRKMKAAVRIMGDVLLAYVGPDDVPKEALILIIPGLFPVYFDPLVQCLSHVLCQIHGVLNSKKMPTRNIVLKNDLSLDLTPIAPLVPPHIPALIGHPQWEGWSRMTWNGFPDNIHSSTAN